MTIQVLLDPTERYETNREPKRRHRIEHNATSCNLLNNLVLIGFVKETECLQKTTLSVLIKGTFKVTLPT